MTSASDLEEHFSQLVHRTEGLQPGRRLFHAAVGLIFVGILSLEAVSAPTMVLGLSILLVLLVAFDLVRLSSLKLNTLFYRWFRLFVSPREEMKAASSTWYVLGTLIVIAIFPEAIAIAGILVLALADPSASYVGRRWGRQQLGGGTVLGTAMFFIVGLMIFLRVANLPTAAAAALFTAILEGRPWPLDDNIVVPVAASGILYVLSLGL